MEDVSPTTNSGKQESAVQRGALAVRILDYARTVMQETAIGHATFANFYQRDDSRGRQAAYMIALAAIDWAIEERYSEWKTAVNKSFGDQITP